MTNGPVKTAGELLKVLQRVHPDTRVILVTGMLNEDTVDIGRVVLRGDVVEIEEEEGIWE